MLDLLKNKRQTYQQNIMSNLEEYSYRHKRYNVEYAIAVGLCDNDVDFSDLGTGTFIDQEDHIHAVIFQLINAHGHDRRRPS